MGKNKGKRELRVSIPKRRISLVILLFAFLLLMLLLVPLVAAYSRVAIGAVGTETITVTTTDDELNGDGDCSLREAIQSANTDSAIDACQAGSGADIVIIPSGTYTITIPGTGDDANATGDFDIWDDLSLQGGGALSTTIDGGFLDRVLHVLTATVEILGVTIQNGYPNVSGAGGGMLNVNGMVMISDSTITHNLVNGGGGGLFNLALRGGTANLTIDNVQVLENMATNQPAGIGWGGGISNHAAHPDSMAILTVTGSLIAGNQAVGAASFYDGIGGGISSGPVYSSCSNCGAIVVIQDSTIRDNSADNGGGILSSPLLTVGSATNRVLIDSSTISGNVANGTGQFKGIAGGILIGGGSSTILNSTISGNYAAGTSTTPSGQGGGIFVLSNYGLQAAVAITNTTIASNTAAVSGGAIAVSPSESPTATVQFANSIVADNAAPLDPSCHDSVQGILSLGYNLEDADLCGFDQSSDLTDTDPMLMLLGNYGGATETHALSMASPAVDQGSCPGTILDQRGSPRPIDIPSIEDADDGCDIGSYELNPIYVYLSIILGTDA